MKPINVFFALTFASTLLISAASAFGQTNDPIGIWKTFDDRTQEAKALVQISQSNDEKTLDGVVLKGLGKNDKPERLCTACKDERKDQPIKGMTIIKNIKKISDDTWGGGEILDPENGKTYRCQLTLKDNGNTLVVRGYIGTPMLGRSQTWKRAP